MLLRVGREVDCSAAKTLSYERANPDLFPDREARHRSGVDRSRVFLIVAGLVAASFAVACDGKSQNPPETTPPTNATARSTANEVDSPTSTPFPPQDEPLGLIDPVAGIGVEVLEKGDSIGLPAGMVLYLNATCYACEGGYNLQRVYRAAAGTIVADSVMPPGTGPRGGGDTYVHSFAVDANGYDAYAILCEGYCGGIGPIEPGSTAELVRSDDGGITWALLTAIELGAWVNIEGVYKERALVGRYSNDDPDAEPQYTWYPGGEPATPPSDFPNSRPRVVPGYGLAWTDQPGGDSGPLRVRTLKGSGIDLARPDDTRLQWSLMETTPDGFLLWYGYPRNNASKYSYVAFATPAGEVDRVVAWAGYDFRLEGRLDGRLFIGNALTTDDTGIAVQLAHGPLAFEPVMVDLTATTVHVIRDLPPAQGSIVQGPYTFPYLALTGAFARVSAGDDCLHIRKEPTTDSESLGCSASGVLLQVRHGLPPEEDWTPVGGPGDIEGWAASEFLIPTAGGAD